MKRSLFTCNRCGKTDIGDNHAAHWRRLKQAGWTKGDKKNVHYCATCAVKI